MKIKIGGQKYKVVWRERLLFPRRVRVLVAYPGNPEHCQPKAWYERRAIWRGFPWGWCWETAKDDGQ